MMRSLSWREDLDRSGQLRSLLPLRGRTGTSEAAHGALSAAPACGDVRHGPHGARACLRPNTSPFSQKVGSITASETQPGLAPPCWRHLERRWLSVVGDTVIDATDYCEYTISDHASHQGL
jgi:hypothetical protein